MPRTLLLADDSITIQKVVAITFAAEDFTVVTVDNGEEAYARAKELRPAIILADVSMPRRNGYELAYAIKADPELRNIPVLLLAGTFEPLDPGKAAASQANGHLAKPFDTQVLIDKVNELLGAPGAQAAAPAPVAPSAPAPVPLARPPAPQPWPAAGARPPQPGAVPAGAGLPQRPVPLTPQAAPPPVRPATSPFGLPAAASAVPAPPMAPAARPAAAAPAMPAPVKAPLPLTSPFPSAPSAFAPRPEASVPAVPQPVSAFSPPNVSVPGNPSPFPAAFPRQPPIAQPAPRAPLMPPAQAAPAPLASPTTNLWGPPPSAPARAPSPSAPSPASLDPFVPPTVQPLAPRVPPPSAPSPVPLPAPRVPSIPAAALTPTWGKPDQSTGGLDPLGLSAFPAPPQTSSGPPTQPFGISDAISGMAEAAAAASVQGSPGDLSLDVAMDEDPPELLPEIDGFELGGSQDLDVSLTGGGSPFVSGALSDFSQVGGSTASGGLDFDDEGSEGPTLELASPHEFLGGPQPSTPPSASTQAAPTAQFQPRAVAASAVPAAAADSDGEATLRLALSQASREVIERVVWEVVPQLAEIILREHVERMERERTPR